MKTVFTIFTRSVRTKPIREVSFHPVLASYQLSSLKTAPVTLVPETTPLLEALKTLEQQSHGAVLVGENTLSGILTERDVIRKTDGMSGTLSGLKVKDVMTQNPITLKPDQSLDEAVDIMFQGAFRHLPILADPIQVLGINQCLSEILRLQVLHKYNKASKQSLKPLGSRFVRVDQSESVQEALKLMNAADVGSLVVYEKTGEGKRLAGILAERDFINQVALSGKDPTEVRVSEIMTSGNKVKTVAETKSVLKGLEAMTKHGHRHLPMVADVKGKVDSEDIVVDEEKSAKVTGMLSSKHIIKYVYQI